MYRNSICPQISSICCIKRSDFYKTAFQYPHFVFCGQRRKATKKSNRSRYQKPQSNQTEFHHIFRTYVSACPIADDLCRSIHTRLELRLVKFFRGYAVGLERRDKQRNDILRVSGRDKSVQQAKRKGKGGEKWAKASSMNRKKE